MEKGMVPSSPLRVLALLGAVHLAACAVPSKDAIMSALGKSDMKAAVDAARKDGRSAAFLARQILIKSSDDESLAEDLARLLAGSGSRMLPVCEALGTSAHPVIRATCLMKLHLHGKRGALSALEPYLDEGPGLARAAAVGAFLEEDQGKTFYERYIDDPEVEVRLRIVQHLAALEEPWAADMLLDAARHDPEAGVRAVALRALDPEQEVPLEALKLASSDENPVIAIAALEALAGDPKTDSLPWLQAFLTPPVKTGGIHYAAALLRHGKNQAAEDYLVEAGLSESPTVRQKLLGALRLYGVALKGSVVLADDKNPDVRFAWCLYARKMGHHEKERIDILRALAKRSDEIALRALVALAEEKSVPYKEIRNKVWKSLTHGDAKAKTYILSFLGRSILDPPLALEAMKDPEPAIRILAAAAYLNHP
jgi:hypothetical protein